MLDSYYQKAFYCGHFIMQNTPALKNALRNLGWRPEKLTSEMHKQEAHYYKNFIDFNFHSRVGEGIWATRLPINQFITIHKKTAFHSLLLNEIKLYILPYRIVLFSIETTMRGSLYDFCNISKLLRDITHYRGVPKPWLELVIKPLLEVYKLLTGSDKVNYNNLVENGSKMKVYQIVGGDFDGATHEQRCRILYKMGTFSTNSDEMGSGMQVSDRYICDVLKTNMLSVYKDWWSLSLLDSHTVMSYNGINKEFVNTHVLFFRMIYLYELFSKCFLFDLHRRHHSVHKNYKISNISIRNLLGIQLKPIDKLTTELNAFETGYAFYNISYDYLPLELHEYISRGLQVDDERKAILDLITREKENEDAHNTKRLNVIIRCLSLFTFFLSIPAACDLANHIIPFEKWMYNESVGYLLFSLFFVLLSVVGVLFLLGYVNRVLNSNSLITSKNSKRGADLKIKRAAITTSTYTNQEDVSYDLISHFPWEFFENFYIPGSVHDGRVMSSNKAYKTIVLQPYGIPAIMYRDEINEREEIRVNYDYRFRVLIVHTESHYIEVGLAASSMSDEQNLKDEFISLTDIKKAEYPLYKEFSMRMLMKK